MARVAVIGAGTMGHAIALVYALGGHQVRLTDSNMMTLDKAQGLMEAALATLVEGGEAPPDWTSAHLAQMVTRHFSLEETVEGAELIIEAIIETPNAKAALYRQLEACAPAEAIIASNTSQLDIFPLIPEGLQSRALITHWYTPPYLVDLVDVIAGPQCEAEHVATVTTQLREMGKQPIGLKKFVPGYVANRIQAAIGLEVQALLDEGVASAAEIDAAIIHGLALRIPILDIEHANIGMIDRQVFSFVKRDSVKLVHRKEHAVLEDRIQFKVRTDGRFIDFKPGFADLFRIVLPIPWCQFMGLTRLLDHVFQITGFLLNACEHTGNEEGQHGPGGIGSFRHLILKFVSRVILVSQNFGSFGPQLGNFQHKSAVVDSAIASQPSIG